VPARYGGFETCVEQVGLRLVKAGHEVVVYCRVGDGEQRPAEYEGMKLVHLPALRKKSLETLSHTFLSVLHMMRHKPDAAIVFNAANAVFLPLLRARGIPVATHVDGLEWKRTKWQGAGRLYYRMAESLAVRWSDALIADAQGIADYYDAEFDAPTELIAYGAPILSRDDDRLSDLGLTSRGFHVAVARFEPENHVDVIVEGYTKSAASLPLVVVGSAPYADEHTAKIHALADDRVTFLGGVWDQHLLDQLYSNCATYLHGHSVGGTNPSLLRAIGAGAATIAYNVNFNREVIAESGRYFTSAAEVAKLIESAEAKPERTRARGRHAQQIALRYDWDDVAARYELMCRTLAEGGQLAKAQRPSGRRNGIDTDALPVVAVPDVEPQSSASSRRAVA
jgi:glycosyltransferase involved in cell wall biosynthesis